MTPLRYRRVLLWVLALASGLGQAEVAQAATVWGTVRLPAALRTGRRYFGHWRVENTNIAIQRASSRGGTIVLLAGPQFQAVPPKEVSVDLSGLKASPSAVVVSEGSVVEFKNDDKVTYELSTPDHPQVMPPERLSAGSVRKQRFATAGEYLVRCSEYPHIVVSVIVTSSPLFAVVDDRGGFKIPNVPEGHATLKVWSQGRWVHEQAVNVSAKGLDLSVRVKAPATRSNAD